MQSGQFMLLQRIYLQEEELVSIDYPKEVFSITEETQDNLAKMKLNRRKYDERFSPGQKKELLIQYVDDVIASGVWKQLRMEKESLIRQDRTG